MNSITELDQNGPIPASGTRAHLTLDLVVNVEQQGLILVGWLFDVEAVVLDLALSEGTHSCPGLLKRAARLLRNDVSTHFGRSDLADHRHGFILCLPADALTGEAEPKLQQMYADRIEQRPLVAADLEQSRQTIISRWSDWGEALLQQATAYAPALAEGFLAECRTAALAAKQAALPQAVSSDLQGCIDKVTATSFSGWCIQTKKTWQIPRLELLINQQVVTTFAPTIVRQDINALFKRRLVAGFTCHIDAELAQAILAAQSEPVGDIDFSVRIQGTSQCLGVIGPIVARLDREIVVKLAQRRYFNDRDPFAQRFSKLRELVETGAAVQDEEVKLIAYYLPQFHPFPENNEWWGEGFTEWTNVVTAKPQYEGHYQPHLPADLGFYDLRLDEVRERQAELAREHGIYGFCYHYYWFGGRTLMDRPIRALLETGKPDFPFCLCWANEPWSRRWDGSESEVLLGQPHKIDIDERFILDILPYLKDPRYIRIDGAPLLLIYRIGLIEEPQELFHRWRLLAAERGVPDLHISMAETFGQTDPYRYGCDSAAGFPPHGLVTANIAEQMSGLEPQFKGKVYDYQDIVRRDMSLPSPAYLTFRGIMPSWDNTARKSSAGHVFHGATPELYELWLRRLIDVTRRTNPPGQRLIFINAWNEWAEGTHLEPDRQHGRAYLLATRRALTGQASADSVLEELTYSETVDPDTLQAAVSTLRAELDSLRRTNAFLGARYQEQINDPMRSVWSRRWIDDLEKIQWETAHASFYIDRVNQYLTSDGGSEFFVERPGMLELSGWFFVQSLGQEDGLLLICLEDETGALIAALVKHHYARPDVNTTFGDKSKQKCGFIVRSRLQSLNAGRYRVVLMHKIGDDLFGYRTPCWVTVLD